ncbi:SH3 domain-containing protein [Mucilaginibacter sp. UR6-11]|uniref:SH3 domain-containing protein n=1 Tax=Mucilaginibacter sp. UR6-11 TaxID=1435644 RepID=UPI001E42D07C|nr:SH3 domain-containing protein [Mucilaginibacter sp. UR6-11]MCC8426034.1 SH3 domain-containing protein [Mucilaginibacter sp. UR6-11]
MANRLRRYSTSFKVIMILITLIFTGYIFKLTTGTKQVILPAVDSTAAIHPPKKRKRKHRVKNRTVAIAVVKPVTDSTKIIPVKKIAAVKVVPQKSEQAVTMPLTKPVPAKHLPGVDSTAKSFLYTTSVQPNVTGIVKLRQQANFYSDVITNIPANAKVQVLEKGPTYYRIAYNNNIGFVPRWALQNK